MGTSFRHFSAAEVEIGLRYAHEKLNTQLDRDTLRALADKTGVRWYKNGRKRGGVVVAKREVLLEHLWQRNRTDTDRRNAYSSAVSKMFSSRSHRKPTREKIAARISAPSNPLFGFNEKGEGIFLFPSS